MKFPHCALQNQNQKIMWNQCNVVFCMRWYTNWFDRIILSNHFIKEYVVTKSNAKWQYMFLYENRKNYVKSLHLALIIGWLFWIMQFHKEKKKKKNCETESSEVWVKWFDRIFLWIQIAFIPHHFCSSLIFALMYK